MRIAEELDYTPAAAARTLVTQRSHVVGVFLETGEGHPDVHHPFFHEVLGGLKQYAGGAGYDLLMFASERPGNGYGTHSYLKRCRHHNVDGAVLMGTDEEDPEMRRLVRSDVATVGVDLELEGPLTTTVVSDNEAGSAAAVRHLHELGHRRIAHITGMLDKRPGAERLRGYRHELQRLGVTPRDEYVAYGDFYVESGDDGDAQAARARRAADRGRGRRRHDRAGRDPRRQRGRPRGPARPLGGRLRRHPARRVPAPAADDAAPAEGRASARRPAAR